MRFPGYWIKKENGELTLARRSFDETELDPATNWKTALQNQEGDFPLGFVDPLMMTQALCRFAIDEQADALAGAFGKVLDDGKEVAITDLPSLAAAILHCAPKMVVDLPKGEPLIGSEDAVEIPFG
jgi:hypothetical protein